MKPIPVIYLTLVVQIFKHSYFPFESDRSRAYISPGASVFCDPKMANPKWRTRQTKVSQFDHCGPSFTKRLEGPGEHCLIRASWGRAAQQGMVFRNFFFLKKGIDCRHAEPHAYNTSIFSWSSSSEAYIYIWLEFAYVQRRDASHNMAPILVTLYNPWMQLTICTQFDIEDTFRSQMTAVKTRHPLACITRPYRGLKSRTHRSRLF